MCKNRDQSRQKRVVSTTLQKCFRGDDRNKETQHLQGPRNSQEINQTLHKNRQKLIIIKKKKKKFILSAWLILMTSKSQAEVRDEGIVGEGLSSVRLKSRLDKACD